MKVSILTACYNCEKSLSDCVLSVRDQKYDGDIEMVVVDDMSNDKSWVILNKYKRKFDFINIYRNKKREYCSSSYLNALNRATGDICCILDADDALLPNAVSEIVKLYKNNPDLLHIYTQHYTCNDKLNNRKRGVSRMPSNNNNLLDSFLEGGQHCYSHWRTFRASAKRLTQLFKPGLKHGIDKYLGFKLEEIGKGGFYDKPLYLYRRHKKNMTHMVGSKQRETITREAYIIREARNKSNPSINPKGVVKL